MVRDNSLAGQPLREIIEGMDGRRGEGEGDREGDGTREREREINQRLLVSRAGPSLVEPNPARKGLALRD